MLNYTTTTFINSDSDVVFCNGSHLYNASAPTTAIEGSDTNVSKKFMKVNFGPEIYNDGTIHKACVIGKKPYAAANNAKLDFNLATSNVNTNGTIYRLVFYLRQRNNNSPIFSNTWVFKGKPIIIEYTGTGNNATTVTNLLETINKKYMLNVYGEEIFTASNPSGLILRLEAKDLWTIFMDQDGKINAFVEKLVPYNSTTETPEHWENVITITTTTSSSNVINNGNEAFGDFAHIMKDLRLPTRENTNYFGIAVGAGENHDKPNPSGHYTEYVIQLTSERGVLQQSAAGGVGVSRTVHVFYVESSATSNFEAALIGASMFTDSDSGGDLDSNEVETGDII